MGQRWIKIHLDTEDEDTEDEDYADVANLAWMMLRALPYNGAVEPDDKAQANLGALDARWSAYEREAQWSGQPTTP